MAVSAFWFCDRVSRPTSSKLAYGVTILSASSGSIFPVSFSRVWPRMCHEPFFASNKQSCMSCCHCAHWLGGHNDDGTLRYGVQSPIRPITTAGGKVSNGTKGVAASIETPYLVCARVLVLFNLARNMSAFQTHMTPCLYVRRSEMNSGIPYSSIASLRFFLPLVLPVM